MKASARAFHGKKIWIIGASSGIGHAVAEELAARGAQLILSSRDAAALNEVATKITPSPSLFPLDVSDPAAIRTIAAQILEHSDIDSVLYMAGRYHPAEIAAMDMNEAEKIIATNFTGALHITHALLPAFVKRGHGQIALCASVAGYRGLPNSQPYAATKAALINFAESLRGEMRKTGIDIKVINPGFVKTPMTDKNSFAMPMMIGSAEAARAIADGLNTNIFEIHFPKRFTRLMKLLRLMPDWLYFRLPF